LPRTESRTKTAIWSDEEFCKLSGSAQRRYWQLYSQPNISLCGVVAYTPGRWSRQCCDDGEEQILADLEALSDAHYIIVDFDTEEIFVRSFMRSDHVWPNPKIRGAAIASVTSVLSTVLRDAIGVEMARLEKETGLSCKTQKP
jgi:hypothetical protein